MGRPRKSEQRENHKAAQEQVDTEIDTSPQMTTRRSARRSAISNLDASQSTELTDDVAKQESEQAKEQATDDNSPSEEKITVAKDETMGGTEENTVLTSHKDTSTPARTSKKKSARSSADTRTPSGTSKSKHAANAPGQSLKIRLEKPRSSGPSVQDGMSRKDIENGTSKSDGCVCSAAHASAMEILIELRRLIHAPYFRCSRRNQRSKTDPCCRSCGTSCSPDYPQRCHGDYHSHRPTPPRRGQDD